MAEHTANGPTPRPLLVWSLASFHAAVLVAVAIGLLYAAGLLGNQLAALDTSVGVVAYGYLWAVTWWTNRRLLHDLGVATLAERVNRVDLLVASIKWSGVAGLSVFLPLFVLLVALFVGTGGVEAVPVLLLFGVFGLAVSIGVGVAVGGLLTAVDLLALRLVSAWLPDDVLEPVDATSRTDTP